MCTPVTAPADPTDADIFKEDTSNAKRKTKKKKWAFMGTPVKPPADLIGADIFKEDRSKAKREKK